jgi:FlaA1/EpsC-like NDP-sugar epimerase
MRNTAEDDMSDRIKKVEYVLIRVALVIFDILLILAGTLGTYLMTNDVEGFVFDFKSTLAYWILGNLILAGVLFYFTRMYTMVYASVGFPEALRILIVTGVIAFANLIFVFVCGREELIGYSVVLFYSLLLFCGLTISRFSKRFYNAFKTQFVNLFTKKTRVVIIGCNNDAFTLIRNMVFNEKSRYKAVCLVEDDERYLGKRIYDVRVVGTTHDLKEVVKKYNIQEIFVAVPSLSKHVQREILHRCKECGLPIRLLPELSKMTNGEISVSKLRHVNIEDLLGREQVSVNLGEVMGYIENKVVLVTGGGGSIGS